MKRLLVVFAMLAVASGARADHIGVYNDGLGSECFKASTPFVPVTVYVVHVYTWGTVGSQFKVEDSTGCIHLGWSAPGLVTLGDPYTGIAVAYGQCYFGHATVLELSLLPTAAPTSCSQTLRVVADPAAASGDILAYDCNEQEHPASGGQFSFYGPCGLCSANPAELSTWGKVKSLYR